MTRAADSRLAIVARQVGQDLRARPNRLAMTWRIALLCAVVCGAAMTFRIPEAAISCYLIIYLSKQDAADNCATGLGLIFLVSLVVPALLPLINFVIDDALYRLLAILLFSYLFLFLGSASVLGEQAAIIGLIIAVVLSVVGSIPVGQIGNQALMMAWKMVALPMGLMVLFNLILGLPPQRLVRQSVVERLRTAAAALESPAGRAELKAQIEEGNGDAAKQAANIRKMHLLSKRRSAWLNAASASSYRLLLAVSTLLRTRGEGAAGGQDGDLVRALRETAEAIEKGKQASVSRPSIDAAEPSEQAVRAWLEAIASPSGGPDPRPEKVPFFASDALSNPIHQRFAIKTAFAAVICYLIYTGANWSGIHTAMITCFVVSLSTTGETLHKLILRISGASIGAVMGVAAILFVIPQITSVGGLMVLIFCALLPAAWVTMGPERISYAGVQIGLAFLLTVLNGFKPDLNMSAAGDRIAGILLGNLVIWLIFTQVWPRPAVEGARAHIATALSALARFAALPEAERPRGTGALSTAQSELAQAGAALAATALEPRSLRPSSRELRKLEIVVREAGRLCGGLSVARGALDPLAARLSEASARTRAPAAGAADAAEATAVEDGGLSAGLAKIEAMGRG